MELGQILYEGPSMLDGQPIVVLASYSSKNRKTGHMIQVWIMRSDIPPNQASKEGADASVCGSCKHRHHTGGECYVVLIHGPLEVWKAYKRGRYKRATSESLSVFNGRSVRFGSYGDPAAVPFEVLHRVAQRARMTTGYTHQIGHPNFDTRLLAYCMVSTDSETPTKAHHRHGRRTFRLKDPGQPVLKGEVVCPATTTDHIQCMTCGICNGAHAKGRSVVIDVHGQRSETRLKRIPTLEVADG